MTRKLNEAGEQLIKQWEALILYPYDDAASPKNRHPIQSGDKVRGTLTAGWGHTGPDVKPGMKVTTALAQKWFEQDTGEAARAVEQYVKVPLTDNQFGALVAFTLNVGVGAFRGSTLLRKLNAGNYGAVPSELAKWNKTTIGGKKVKSNGLVNRRAAEAGLWVKGDFVASSSVAAEPEKPPLVSSDAMALGTTALSTGALQFVPTEGPLAWALAAVVIVGLGFLAWNYIQRRRQE